ncbi:MAG: hypothetical protein IMZ50_09925 [Candidatus Atribacteria bacterium]|nr:hypothetical protein [Candidatus Atribacteria bacterium]
MHALLVAGCPLAMGERMTHLERWIGGWIAMGCGLAEVLSLGFWSPQWHIRWLVRCLKRQAAELGEEEERFDA